MRHALADLEGGRGLRGLQPLWNSKDKKVIKQNNRKNEKGKGNIEKVLNVYLICVCTYFYNVILYLYNLKNIYSFKPPPLKNVSAPGHEILFSKYFTEMCIK